MKAFSLSVLVLLLTGCASTPKAEWVTVRNADRFTDKTSCAVTVGSYYTGTSIYTVNNHYYPYIEKVNGDLRVGLKSGGRMPIPVGDFQFRIDQNKAWSVSTSETPLDYVPEGQLKAIQAYAANDPQHQQIAENAYKVAMESAVRTMSPFTAATGEKAQSILNELRSGSKLIYRTVGLNQAASTTGEFRLDSSLDAALRQCGIL